MSESIEKVSIIVSKGSLENIYTEKQDWPSLFATFQREMEVVMGDSARSDVTAKMAHVSAFYLGQPDKAITLAVLDHALTTKLR